VLASGVAHHFNNLLSVVVGHVEMASCLVEEGSPAWEHLHKAEAAALRSRDVTQQLLAFARGGGPVRRIASIAATVTDVVALATCGSNVAGRVRVDGDLWLADVDVAQIGQVVHNLVENAVQAMPGGGALEVTVANERLERPERVPVAPGPYVRIDVVDQGVGIPAGLAARIFDPFFTTRRAAGGMGLGLHIAYNLVTGRLGGEISVHEPDAGGAGFLIRLPLVAP
jgi:two-component system cell cycle sensor histidine kinase/response regulator CckA